MQNLNKRKTKAKIIKIIKSLNQNKIKKKLVDNFDYDLKNYKKTIYNIKTKNKLIMISIIRKL